MSLTRCQEAAVNSLKKWYKENTDDKQSSVFRIFGYAGTGKSYCINEFLSLLDINKETEVKYATFTGKAALVLRKKGLPATTIHKLIYTPVEEIFEEKLPDGTVRVKQRVRFVKKLSLDMPGSTIKLIILDECSMISKKLWDDLLSFNKKIVVLGDTGQLPPIEGQSPIMSEKPDAFLDEIVRQATDNPIIYLSMLAREGRKINYGNYGNLVYVKPLNNLSDEDITKSGIVLSTTNSTRDSLNSYIRGNIYNRRNPLPSIGDKLICRKNNWGKVLNGIPLVNGLIGSVESLPIISESNSKIFSINFKPEGFNQMYFEDLECNVEMFSAKTANERKELASNKYLKGNAMEYGYAITTHLSQGSQWNEVCFYFEPFGKPEFRRQLLYTGITRAENKLNLYL